MGISKEESNNVQIIRALGVIAVVGIHTCGGVQEDSLLDHLSTMQLQFLCFYPDF